MSSQTFGALDLQRHAFAGHRVLFRIRQEVPRHQRRQARAGADGDVEVFHVLQVEGLQHRFGRAFLERG